MIKINYKFFCLFIFVFLSLILFLQVPDNNRLELDSLLYDRIAKNFAQNLDLSDPDAPKIMPVTAIGYPLFMGLVFKVFNTPKRPCVGRSSRVPGVALAKTGVSRDGENGRGYKIIILSQVLLSILCFFLIYNTCYILFDIKTAKISFFLSCINLGFIIHAQFILTEILLVTFLLLFLYFFAKFIILNKKLDLFYSGLFLGVSILIKPVAIFFFSVPILLIFFNKNLNLIYKLKNNFIFMITFFVPVLGYIFFNYKKYNIVDINPAGYENIYRYYLPRVISRKNNIPLELAQNQVDNLVVYNNDNNNINLRYSPELKNLLIKALLNSPVTCLYVWVYNIAKTYFGLYTTELKVLYNKNLKGGVCSYFKMSGGFLDKIFNYVTFGANSKIIKMIGFWEIFYLLLQYLLIVFACYNLFLNKQFNILFLLLVFIVYFALITGHDGFGRYRMVFEPVLIILNSFGIAQVFKIFLKQEKYA